MDINTIIIAVIAGLPGLISLYKTFKYSKLESEDKSTKIKQERADTILKISNAIDKLQETYFDLLTNYNKEKTELSTVLAKLQKVDMELKQTRRINKDLAEKNDLLLNKLDELKFAINELIQIMKKEDIEINKEEIQAVLEKVKNIGG